MPQQALVRKIEAFAPLTDAERNTLGSLCSAIQLVERKRMIVSEGDRSTHVRVMLDGWAARFGLNSDGGRRITAFLLPGDFSEVHALSLDLLDHGMVAITDCKIGLIEPAVMDEVMRSTPALTLAFLRSTLVDAAILRQWLVNAGRRSARQTIAHLLCELHARLELIGLAAHGSFELPLTQEEIGDATGLTAVHVNRMFRELRELGLIVPAVHHIHIPDVAALRREADFSPGYLHLRT